MFRVQQLRVRRSEYAMKCLCYVTLVCELDCSSTYFLNSLILIYKVTYTYMKLVINFTVNLFVNSVHIFGLLYEIY